MARVGELEAGAQMAFRKLLKDIEGGKVGDVQAALERDHGLLETTDELGNTPLIAAAALGRHEIARLLADLGADVNAQDTSGRTPLFWAEVNSYAKTFEVLESAGGKILPVDEGAIPPRLHKSFRSRCLVKS